MRAVGTLAAAVAPPSPRTLQVPELDPTPAIITQVRYADASSAPKVVVKDSEKRASRFPDLARKTQALRLAATLRHTRALS